MTKKKLLIIGHGRHGKDTVCEMLRDGYGYTFESSSRFCSKLFIYDALKDKYGYASEEDCYNDRHNHRAEWFNLIAARNADDPTRLGREIFAEYDIYCGNRNVREVEAMRESNVLDLVVWVDRSDHLPPEDVSSMTVTQAHADVIIYNNGDLDQLRRAVNEFAYVHLRTDFE